MYKSGQSEAHLSLDPRVGRDWIGHAQESHPKPCEEQRSEHRVFTARCRIIHTPSRCNPQKRLAKDTDECADEVADVVESSQLCIVFSILHVRPSLQHPRVAIVVGVVQEADT